jgi:hypothetical protein
VREPYGERAQSFCIFCGGHAGLIKLPIMCVSCGCAFACCVPSDKSFQLQSTMSGAASRLKGHKKGIDGDDCREHRAAVTTELRKNKRDEMLQKRRMTGAGASAPGLGLPVGATSENEGASVNGGDVANLSVAEQVREIPMLLHKLQQPSVDSQLEGVAGFRKLLSIGACFVVVVVVAVVSARYTLSGPVIPCHCDRPSWLKMEGRHSLDVYF